MLRRSWSAAPALLVATCTLGNTDVRACDYGCDGGCGGYGYGAASYAYSPYPAYANYAPPLYYQPAYAYYAPPTFYTYAPPIYGPAYPAYYAPTAYGAPSYRPPYWRGPYAGPQYGSAPRIDRRTAVAVAAARPVRPHGRLSSGARPAPVRGEPGDRSRFLKQPPGWPQSVVCPRFLLQKCQLPIERDGYSPTLRRWAAWSARHSSNKSAERSWGSVVWFQGEEP